MKRNTRWIVGGILLSIGVILALIFSFRESILLEAGKFMAPEGDYVADVAILEGAEFIHRDIVKNGVNLLRSGKVKRIVVVLHNIAPSHRPFAFNENYADLVTQELEGLGLKKNEFKIIVTHIHHPVTLTEARQALETLSQEGVKSAILLSSGFHARRSFLAYQYLAIPLQIKIFPHACFNGYQLDKWWTQDNGVRDFMGESLKLAYYLIMGYIPLRFSYSL
jgi:hypothetical protein